MWLAPVLLCLDNTNYTESQRSSQPQPLPLCFFWTLVR